LNEADTGVDVEQSTEASVASSGSRKWPPHVKLDDVDAA
jgi:hypothetical protein